VPPRRSVRDRLGQDQARGRAAIYGQPEPAPSPPPPAPARREGPSWDDTHQRVTFYCPLELLEAIEAERERTGRSKSRVITDALREHLAHQGY
jgi:Ribbon-helix-helix protein, copG family